jgi:hypothetical protein
MSQKPKSKRVTCVCYEDEERSRIARLGSEDAGEEWLASVDDIINDIELHETEYFVELADGERTRIRPFPKKKPSELRTDANGTLSDNLRHLPVCESCE